MALSPTEQQIADDLLTHTLDLFRLDASLRGNALNTLQRLQAELRAKLSAGDLTAFGKDATRRLLDEASAVIADYYQKIQNHVEEALNALPEVQAQAIRDSLTGVGYGAALAPPTHFATAMTAVMIQGAPSSEWWSRQSADTQFRFSNAVRQGIVQGRTNQQIIGDVLGRGPGQGILEVSRRNAAALVQTSVQTVANVARLESFAQNADVVKGVEQISTLDGHTTDICIAYSGGQWDLEGKPLNGTKLPFKGGPPRHWNCRSLLVPKTKTFKELGIDVSEKRSTTRASADGQISAGTTFADFLTRKGEAFQNEILGPGRAQLWRDKKITLQQLLDLHGNPLSLAELQAKYKVAQVPKVRPAREPKAKPPKPLPDFVEVGTFSQKFKDECKAAYEKVPLGIREKIAEYGGRVTISDTLTNGFPVLKGKTPRGWAPSSTWDSVEGCAKDGSIWVSQKYIPSWNLNAGYQDSQRITGVFLHEMGHAFDCSLSRVVDDQKVPFSAGKKFRTAYTKDIKELTRRGLLGKVDAYYKQEGVAGLSETFAEVFGWVVEVGCDSSTVLKDYFVESSRVIENEMLRYKKRTGN